MYSNYNCFSKVIKYKIQNVYDYKVVSEQYKLLYEKIIQENKKLKELIKSENLILKNLDTKFKNLQKKCIISFTIP